MGRMLTFILTVSIVSFACGNTGKNGNGGGEQNTHTAQHQEQKQEQKQVQVKKECQNYVKRMEECLSSTQGKDYVKVWRQCEGQAMWDMLKEYQDNGFCFDEEECKQKVLEEINSCKEERNALFRKHYK